MKKLLLGLLTLAIITLTLTSCQQPTTPVNTGTAPKINKAFFCSQGASTVDETESNYKITTISIATGCKFLVTTEDAEKDVKKLYISKSSTFDRSIFWENLDIPRTHSNDIFTLGWNWNGITQADKNAWKMTNGTIYVKVVDAYSNVSNVYQITGITITD